MYENDSEYPDTVDPRVQIELERLNNATDEINRLEVELDDCRATFRQLLCESTARVDTIRTKLGMCVERAKPYYEARFCANEALKQTQFAAMKFERANSAHSAAREMVYLAEQGLGGRTLDPAWQEMLNHATQRVNEAERERVVAGQQHRIACVKHEAASAKVHSLQKDLKRAISKSRPYYEMKAQFNQMLEQQKVKVQHYESHVTNAKLTYADALRNLEQISDEIHRSRGNSTVNGSDAQYVMMREADDCQSLPPTAEDLAVSVSNGVSSPSQSDRSDVIAAAGICASRSNEWSEINLDVSSADEEVPYRKLEAGAEEEEMKPKLVRQKTLPNPQIEHEFTSIKGKMKLDASIVNWISRSSAARAESSNISSRRQSLDNILGPTSERVKEIFSQGMMMLNISSLTDRRGSETKSDGDDKKSAPKKIPSPLERTMTYLTAEDDFSDTESLASVDMLNEDQINSLMLDKEIGQVCEQVLGTPMSEVVSLPSCSQNGV